MIGYMSTSMKYSPVTFRNFKHEINTSICTCDLGGCAEYLYSYRSTFESIVVIGIR